MDTIIVPTSFFTAPECPPGCLFTGRTDRVRPVSIQLFGQDERKRFSFRVSIPQGPHAWPDRLLQSRLWLLVPIVCLFAVGLVAGPHSWWTAITFGIVWGGLLLFAAFQGTVKRWRSRYVVTIIALRVPTEVELSFPPSQAQRFEQYRQGLERYQQRLVREGRWLHFSGDWTVHPDLNWQLAERGASPAVATTAAPPAPWQLTVTVDFMNSRFLPHRCLYTGRTDRVLRLFTPLYPAVFLPLPEPVPVALPQAPGAEYRWRLYAQLWLFVPFAIVLPMTVVALFGDHSHDRVWLILPLMVSLALSVLAAVWLHTRRATRLVTRTLDINGRDLWLTFPFDQRDNYEAFRQAWEEYEAARMHGDLNRPGEPGDQPILANDADQAEDWVDHAGADSARDRWDETKQ